MPFCHQCGKSVSPDAAFCAACGARQPAYNQNTVDVGDVFRRVNNTPDSTACFSQEDINQNLALAILAYIGPLVLAPLLGAPHSPYARFHANQGLVLLLAGLAWGIASGILRSIVFLFFGFWLKWLYVIISIALGAVGVLYLALMVIGIVNAAQGKAKELPLIGKFRLLK